jgi:hypothetical protein
MPLGIGSADAIVMPLTPKLLFMARPRQSQIIASAAVPGLGIQTNHLLARQSKQVYSRTAFHFDPTQPE